MEPAMLPKPKQPIRSNFAKGFDGMEDFASAEITYFKALAEYERVRAEQAIETLRKAAKQLARTVNDDFDTVDAVIQGMEKALADIAASQTPPTTTTDNPT